MQHILKDSLFPYTTLFRSRRIIRRAIPSHFNSQRGAEFPRPADVRVTIRQKLFLASLAGGVGRVTLDSPPPLPNPADRAFPPQQSELRPRWEAARSLHSHANRRWRF